MRCALILTLLAASLVHAAWSDYEEVRELSLDAGSLGQLDIDAGAGGLTVIGVAAADRVLVTATIQIPDASDDEAAGMIRSGLRLTLERQGDRAVLKSHFERGFKVFGDNPRIQLEVRMPARMALTIEDGSGSLAVNGVRGPVDVTDGSGSLTLTAVGGPVRIDDGSGSIDVSGVDGELFIVDGSGSIVVRDVSGSVTVDDGSGSINVSGVAGDLTIEDDGRGSLRFSDIEGKVENNS